ALRGDLRNLPRAAGFRGVSPLPKRYVSVAEDVWRAEFEAGDFVKGMNAWLESLGKIREVRFFRLPDDLVRYEVAASDAAGLTYRVGLWKLGWADHKMTAFSPLEETLVRATDPRFVDVT